MQRTSQRRDRCGTIARTLPELDQHGAAGDGLRRCAPFFWVQTDRDAPGPGTQDGDRNCTNLAEVSGQTLCPGLPVVIPGQRIHVGNCSLDKPKAP